MAYIDFKQGTFAVRYKIIRAIVTQSFFFAVILQV